MATLVGSTTFDGMSGSTTFEHVGSYHSGRSQQRAPRTTVRAWQRSFAENGRPQLGNVRGERRTEGSIDERSSPTTVPHSSRSIGADAVNLEGPGLGTEMKLREIPRNLDQRIESAFERALQSDEIGRTAYVLGNDARRLAGAQLPAGIRLCGIAFGPRSRATASVLSYQAVEGEDVPRLRLRVTDGGGAISGAASGTRPAWNPSEKQEARRLLDLAKVQLDDLRP